MVSLAAIFTITSVLKAAPADVAVAGDADIRAARHAPVVSKDAFTREGVGEFMFGSLVA